MYTSIKYSFTEIAFGMVMAGRQYNNASYRYGFNGKENDNEVKGTGNQQDYGMRIYDPRLGKFLSVDPLTNSYPMLTPYQFASNSPIASVDIDGLEAKSVVNEQGKLTAPAIEILKDIVPGGADLLNKVTFVVNDSYVPEGMGAITIGLTVYMTTSNAKYLEGNTGQTLEMVGHEGTHANDVDNIGVMFYLEYARESVEAYMDAGFSTTNPKTGKHIHDDLPLEQTANSTEQAVGEYVKNNPSVIKVLESKESDQAKTQIIKNTNQSKDIKDSSIPKTKIADPSKGNDKEPNKG